MRRTTRNKKVARALAVGLAAMIAVTSTPASIRALESEGIEVNINIPVNVTGEEPADEPASGTANEQPTGGQPTNGQPTNGQPANGQPTNGQPANGQQNNEEPSNEEPSGEEPSNEEPSNEEPSGEQPSGESEKDPEEEIDDLEEELENTAEDIHATLLSDNKITDEDDPGEVYKAVEDSEELARTEAPAYTVSSDRILPDEVTVSINKLADDFNDKKDITANTLSANNYVEEAREDLIDAYETVTKGDSELTLSVNTAKDLGDSAVSAADQGAKAVNGAETTIDEQLTVINNATIANSVDNAVKKAKDAVTDAAKVYDEKLKDFNEKKKAYEAAIEEVQRKKEAFKAALADAAANKKDADDKLLKAEAELKSAQNRLAELEGQLKAAQDEVDKAEVDKKAALKKQYDADKDALQFEYDTNCSAATLSVNNAIDSVERAVSANVIAQAEYEAATVSANSAKDEYDRVWGKDVSGNHIKGSAETEYDEGLKALDAEYKKATDAVDKNYGNKTLADNEALAKIEKENAESAKNTIHNAFSEDSSDGQFEKVIESLVDTLGWSVTWFYSNKDKSLSRSGSDGNYSVIAQIYPGKKSVGDLDDADLRLVKWVEVRVHVDKSNPGYVYGEMMETTGNALDYNIKATEKKYRDLSSIRIVDQSVCDAAKATAAQDRAEKQAADYNKAKSDLKYDEKKAALEKDLSDKKAAAKTALDNANKAVTDAQGRVNTTNDDITAAQTARDKAIAYRDTMYGKYDEDGNVIEQGSATLEWAQKLKDLEDKYGTDTATAGSEADHMRNEIREKYAPLYDQAAALKTIIGEAEKKVADLRAQIAAIKPVSDTSVDKYVSDKIGNLEQELKNAQDLLTNSKTNLDALNGKLTQVEEAAGIKKGQIAADEEARRQAEEDARKKAEEEERKKKEEEERKAEEERKKKEEEERKKNRSGGGSARDSGSGSGSGSGNYGGYGYMGGYIGSYWGGYTGGYTTPAVTVDYFTPAIWTAILSLFNPAGQNAYSGYSAPAIADITKGTTINITAPGAAGNMVPGSDYTAYLHKLIISRMFGGHINGNPAVNYAVNGIGDLQKAITVKLGLN